MALTEIAVDGCTLELSVGSGTLATTSPPSTKCLAEGKGIFKDPLAILISAVTAPNFTQTAPVAGTIPSTATKNKADGALVMLIDDVSGTITLAGVDSSSNPATLNVTVKISVAGQTKVLAQ